MELERPRPRLAVVGMGPRGLGALESLARRYPDDLPDIDVDIFDPCERPGAGPNFAPDQSDLCLLNIPVRELSLPDPVFAETRIAGFRDCLPEGIGAEDYPARSVLGDYFETRFENLDDNARRLRLKLRPQRVDRIETTDAGFCLISGETRLGPYDEVLLTPGQPETAPDDQLARWQSHADTRKLDLVPAYPANALLQAARDWRGRDVAIRGLGLSTLDVLRLLTLGAGGRFEAGRYVASGQEPARILPFSLDGKPPFPKPADARQDARYDPTSEETARFEDRLARAVTAAPDTALSTLAEALAPAIRRILRDCGVAVAAEDVDRWLDAETSDPGSQETGAATELLRAGIAMAEGASAPSVGYVTGQVWRKWQNELRRGFNPKEIAAETRATLVGFDEALKRYSYGPPVSAAREMLALIDAGRVVLAAADDPDIIPVREGWQIDADGARFVATAMVDAVLPSPELAQVSGSLFVDLRETGRIGAVSDKLGALTRPDGRIVDAEGKPQPGLCLLGRLALGSIIAADSVHDCFGASTGRWAEGCVARLSERFGTSGAA
ncbi:FAD/NAD(P)-binding protein [Sulfitobacter sp. D35]|uniref:FAD/NAD(P)-binding protein n=1 Tax=Sulfitobacter sp. D35 TaxID=3083252 RepID=UPI00296E2ADF|nr:FAD/NAD(P)-binding protein [Sulfitobacter sp. D35]MDW4497418.1 FAD/NAD(P)-binding protein [Sulfitobacter sp. D35]